MPPRREPERRPVEVRDTRRITVDLDASTVEHAIRCHVDHTLRDVHRLPPPESFSAISVAIFCDDDGKLMGGAATYDAKRVPEPIVLFEPKDWREEEGPVLWWSIPGGTEPFLGPHMGDGWPFHDTEDVRWQRVTVPVIEGDDRNAYGG